MLVVAAVLALAAPAQAQERVCQPPPGPLRAPTAAENARAELERNAARRAGFGFRHDLTYVRALVKLGVWWEYDRGDYLWVTPREIRYLELRRQLWLGVAASRYLDRHPGLDGGTWVEDAWPKMPYLLVRVTRDPAKHLAALKQLAEYPSNLRTIKVRYSEPELRRLGDRIVRDERELIAAGLHVQHVTVDIEANRTRVELATARTDAAAYLVQRYGPQVQTAVTATTPTMLECNNTGFTFEVAPDGLGLTVSWGTYHDASTERLELAEFADRIEIGIVERVPTGVRDAENTFRTGSIVLSAPLRARAVIDAKSGKPMLQVGPGPDDPPCPVPARAPADAAGRGDRDPARGRPTRRPRLRPATAQKRRALHPSRAAVAGAAHRACARPRTRLPVHARPRGRIRRIVDRGDVPGPPVHRLPLDRPPRTP